MSKNLFVYIYFAAWALLGIATCYVLFGIKQARLKRILFPILVLVASAMAPFFLYLMEFPTRVFYLAIPAAIAIAVLNIAFTKFCETCGSAYKSGAFGATAHCPKCNAKT
jgi:hypothetical protein